jgi:hypothetical protein
MSINQIKKNIYDQQERISNLEITQEQICSDNISIKNELDNIKKMILNFQTTLNHVLQNNTHTFQQQQRLYKSVQKKYLDESSSSSSDNSNHSDNDTTTTTTNNHRNRKKHFIF